MSADLDKGLTVNLDEGLTVDLDDDLTDDHSPVAAPRPGPGELLTRTWPHS